MHTSRTKLYFAIGFGVLIVFLLGSFSRDLPRPDLSSLPSISIPSHLWSSPSQQFGPLPEDIEAALSAQDLHHPIDNLVEHAKSQFAKLQEVTHGVNEAAAAYRARRGRHPPPGFDKWVKFAEEKDALMVESFFDTLNNDIAAFWGVSPVTLREFPASWPFTISIRKGQATRWADESEQGFEDWMSLYMDAVNELPLADIPDIDLAINADDEPHMYVPWQILNQHRVDGEARKHVKPSSIVSSYSTYKPLPRNRPKPEDGFHFDLYPENIPLWTFARETCAEHTPARSEAELLDTDHSTVPEFFDSFPKYMRNGYVSNWTAAKSACMNPAVHGMHGSFIHPQGYSINANGGAVHYNGDKQRHIIKELVPILSGSRMRDVNQEILVPPAIHWKQDDQEFSFDENARIPFDKKNDQVMWRGSASGGVNDINDWIRFHRHRFVAMQNGTTVAASQRAAEDGTYYEADIPRNFPLPNPYLYPLAVMLETDRAKALGEWISQTAHAAFTHIRCWPLSNWFDQDPSVCEYNDKFFRVEKSRPANDFYYYKYLPDLDGASYSGRFRAFLQSNSLPIKATVYDEWHDDRLVPWKHFVPMDNSFMDWWGILQYFVGYEGVVRGRNDVAREIAEDGSQWAQKVVRNEDMVVYLYRLILELARVSDDRRDQMGYVGDLQGHP